jgi:hypothetical protein
MKSIETIAGRPGLTRRVAARRLHPFFLPPSEAAIPLAKQEPAESKRHLVLSPAVAKESPEA